MKCTYFILSIAKTFLFIFSLMMLNPLSASAQQISENQVVLVEGLENPTSLYVTRNHVFVVEQDENRLLKLDLNGNLHETIGGNGNGDYEFSQPIDVDATNGLKIYITDLNNRRIQVFSRRGQYLSSLQLSDNLQISGNQSNLRYSPTQLVVNDVGEVFFYNEFNETIQRYDFNGTRSEHYNLPRDIERVDDIVFEDQTFYVLDKRSRVIHSLTENWIYESFYPAEGVEAFHVDGDQLIKVYKDKIVIESPNESVEIDWKSDYKPVDAHLLGSFLFVLDEQNLYRIEISD